MHILTGYDRSDEKELPAVPPGDSDPEDEEYDPSPEEFGIYPSGIPFQSTGNDATSYRLYTISERTEVSRSGTLSSLPGRRPVITSGIPISSRTDSSYGQLIGI